MSIGRGRRSSPSSDHTLAAPKIIVPTPSIRRNHQNGQRLRDVKGQNDVVIEGALKGRLDVYTPLTPDALRHS